MAMKPTESIMIYDNAVKTAKGQTEYENGAGRIQFNDSDHFHWDNSMEIIEHSEFERASE